MWEKHDGLTVFGSSGRSPFYYLVGLMALNLIDRNVNECNGMLYK